MLRKSLNPITEATLALLAANRAHPTDRIRGDPSAKKIADRERAPQAPGVGDLAPPSACALPCSKAASSRRIQGASRIFMHGGGPRAHDIFTQDDMPLGRCPQPANRRNPPATSFRRPGRPSGPDSETLAVAPDRVPIRKAFGNNKLVRTKPRGY